jgi:hypothetical protein
MRWRMMRRGARRVVSQLEFPLDDDLAWALRFQYMLSGKQERGKCPATTFCANFAACERG